MLTGNDVYREYATAGLDFMYDNAWDSVNGGWYSQMDINGNVIGVTNGRSAFDAHYALLGPSAAFEAFGDSTDLTMLLQGYEYWEAIYWDDRPGFEGYFDWATYTGSASYNKSFNATVDAITTHLLSLYLQTEDSIYLDRLHQISQQIIDHLVGSMSAQSIGFVEKYDSNWNWDNGETMTIMGHVLKSAWCLARVYQIEPRPEYLVAAEVLVEDVLTHGYDHDLGGPYKDYTRTTGEMLMWGNPDTAKAWWQMEQAITAGLQLWDITGDESYLEMADETLHFFMKHFVDHVYGDVYENQTRYGDETWGLNKGGGGKAAYHSIETGYYAYLYGNLLNGSDIFLYYWFDPVAVNRTIKLTPLASAFDALSITSVLLDNEAYSNFSSNDRELYIPADSGGKFKVTFSRDVLSTNREDSSPSTFNLYPAFPNPFNGQTNFAIHLDTRGKVELVVIDIRGRIVQSLINHELTPGKHELFWAGLDNHGKQAPAGLYIIRGTWGNTIQTQKVLLLK